MARAVGRSRSQSLLVQTGPPIGIFHNAAANLLMPSQSSPLSAGGPRKNLSGTLSPSGSDRPSSSAGISPLSRTLSSPMHMRRSTVCVSQDMLGGLQQSSGSLQGSAIPEGETVDSATEKLNEAMSSKDMGKLLKAIGICKSLGVDANLVDEGTKVLQRHSALQSATSSLKRAITEEHMLDLEDALRKSDKAGVDAGEISTGRGLLTYLRAEERLRTAMNMRDKNAIKWALEYAFEGVREKKIEEAHKVLEQIDKTSHLKAALYGGSVNDIQESLRHATASGVTGPIVEEAQKRVEAYKQQQEKTKQANAALEQQAGAYEANMLAQAFKMKDVAALKLALKLAKDAGLPKGDRDKARQLVDQLEAQSILDKAVKSKDRKKVQDALMNAQVAGLEAKDLEVAQKLIAHMDASKGLEDALKRKDKGDLQEAIEKARSCGITGMPIERAERVLGQLEAGVDSTGTPLNKSRSSVIVKEVKKRKSKAAPADGAAPEASGAESSSAS